jgi:hypothetical protein
MRPLSVSGNWFVPASVALLTYDGCRLLVDGPGDFAWYHIALLLLIAAAAAKMYIDGRKHEPVEPE